MLNIKSGINNRISMKANLLGNNRWMFLGIAYSMLAIPFGVHSQPITLALLFVWLAFVVGMAVNNKTGYSLVIIALAMTMPEMTRETDVYIIGLRWPQVFLGLSIVAVAFLCINKKKSNPVHNVVLVCGLFILLYLLYCSNPTFRYFRGLVDAVIFIHVMFYISFHDKMKFEDIFQGVSLIFIFTAIYAITHYFFDVGPYSALTDRSYAESLGYVFIKREGGLFCNSLVMSASCGLYHSLILIRLLKINKMAYLMELLCVTVAFLTISRTVIFVLVVQFIVYMFLNRTIRLRTTIGMVVVLGIFYFMVSKDSGALQDWDERMEVTSEHRESSYSTTLNIFTEHPLGVGKQKVSKYIHEFNSGGIEEDLVTLDNFYLTQIASYGLLSIMSFVFYMLYFFKIPRLLKSRDNKKVFLLVILTWCLLGFSYDVESFVPVSVFCFGLLGLLYSTFKNEEQSLYAVCINNYH